MDVVALCGRHRGEDTAKTNATPVDRRLTRAKQLGESPDRSLRGGVAARAGGGTTVLDDVAVGAYDLEVSDERGVAATTEVTIAAGKVTRARLSPAAR